MNIDELKQIMADDDIGGADLMKVKCNAYEGLKILNKYTKKPLVRHAEYKIIYSISLIDAISTGMTRDDAIKLRRLNWMSDQNGHFACFI